MDIGEGYPHAIVVVERRADYLATQEEANAGNGERLAAFVTESVEGSIGRLIRQE